SFRSVLRQARVKLRERLLELAAENRAHAQSPQVLGVQRRIQTIGAQVRRGIERSHTADGAAGETRGRVHGKVERDQRGPANRLLVERLLREVQAGNA